MRWDMDGSYDVKIGQYWVHYDFPAVHRSEGTFFYKINRLFIYVPAAPSWRCHMANINPQSFAAACASKMSRSGRA